MKIHEKNITHFKNRLMNAIENTIEEKKNSNKMDRTRLKSEK